MLQQLWTESTKPKSLDQLDYHEEISEMLRKLAKNSDFPHLLFYGPNGAGKKTRVLSFLKEVYGSGVYTVTEEEKEYKINETSNTTTSCTVLSSKFHIDVAPSDADHHDKVIIQKLIKEVASSHQVNSKQTKDFKVVIINEVDNLTKEAQASLRRTMEKYIERCRIILICESLARIISPIRSRCLLIRIPAPNVNQIAHILDKISTQYSCKINPTLINKIANASNGNLREAILYLQSTRVSNTCIKDDQNIAAQEWKIHIQNNIVIPIIKNQQVETMKEIREKFYQLLVNCIPIDRIMFEMLQGIINHYKDHAQKTILYEFIKSTAKCENRARQGSKGIVHLEALAAEYMTIIKQFA
ncbi:unnamed protein product [Paramecium sonneborni]|uniref:AAA+ ATPase domain-containing protein n=1 Tax=Paramecium sonneborni TaxID=65129 RepID=A0A8S1NVZ3_9CILI|nr:unnamed protein product [Paramecium sonneborni]